MRETTKLNTWTCITDTCDYTKERVMYLKQVGDTSEFQFVDVAPLAEGESVVYYAGMLDVDAVGLKPIADYHGGIHLSANNFYMNLAVYILDYYGGERFDKMPFYYSVGDARDMMELAGMLKKAGI